MEISDSHISIGQSCIWAISVKLWKSNFKKHFKHLIPNSFQNQIAVWKKTSTSIDQTIKNLKNCKKQINYKMYNCNFCAHQTEKPIEINMHLKLEHNIHIIQSVSMVNIKEESNVDLIQVWFLKFVTRLALQPHIKKFKIIIFPI